MYDKGKVTGYGQARVVGQAIQGHPKGVNLLDVATDGIPDVASPDQLAVCAYTVWLAVSHRAEVHSDMGCKEPPDHIEHRGSLGWLWRGSVNWVVEDIWKALQYPDDATDHAKRELNLYLARSGNLVCIHRGNKTIPSSWFVRGTWNDERPNLPPGPPPTPGQLKLTPAEAGEDRTPEPVSTTYTCAWVLDNGTRCTYRGATLAARNRHIYAEHRSAEDWLLQALRRMGGHGGATAIWHEAQSDGYPGMEANVGKTLVAMAASGDWPVIRTDDLEYHADAPAEAPGPAEPPETPEPAAGGWSCREPGCGAEFDSAYGRHDHENRTHPDSPNRHVECPYECGTRFYDASSIGPHCGRKHPLRSSAPDSEPLRNGHGSPVPPPDSDGDITAADVLRWLQTHLTPELVSARSAQLSEEVGRLSKDNAQLRAELRRARLGGPR